jgi:hypothetical protein
MFGRIPVCCFFFFLWVFGRLPICCFGIEKNRLM